MPDTGQAHLWVCWPPQVQLLRSPIAYLSAVERSEGPSPAASANHTVPLEVLLFTSFSDVQVVGSLELFCQLLLSGSMLRLLLGGAFHSSFSCCLSS